MQSNHTLFKRCLLTIAIICVTLGVNAAQNSLTSQTMYPYTMTAAEYLDLATRQTGLEKQTLEIQAAGRLIAEGEWRASLKILSSLTNLAVDLAQEKMILLAKIDLIRTQAKMAITKLASVRTIINLPIYYQIQYHELLAKAYRATGNMVEAVNERIKLGALLPNDSAQSNNRRALWLILMTLPNEELNTIAVESSGRTELDGWTQLAMIAKSQSTGSKILANLEAWKSQYPNHPGNYILPSPLENISPYLYDQPKKIALLLPITGRLAGPGNAVREGFMHAYESGSQSAHLDIQIYDTAKASATSLYEKAIAEGANYVVGPLGKTDVAAIAAISHPVPTLMLNDTEQSVKQNAYQFGLSPANEARQVAVRARKNGHSRTLVIAPSSPWGEEVSTAFKNQWTSMGGHVVDVLSYSEQEDMAPAIKRLLHASELKRPSRGKKVKETQIKGPMRRQDFDMIFLLAYPSKARQIMPMLRYYFVGGTPVYATSAVYSGSADAQKDRDLEGITFCDMPWVFSHQMGAKNWPEQWNSFNRLYALGMDSFELTIQMNQLLLFPAMGVSEGNGAVYINSKHQITRILVFGKMKQGLAQEVTEG
jgi:outer membrane PBP1 activator LpoA protein